MKTQDYLDAAKVKLHVQSDYALAKALGISREYISQFRLGKRPLSDEISIKLAKILQISPLAPIALANAERAKNPEIQAAWNALLEKISTGFNALISAAKPRRGSFSGA
jgi:transcriptional regulator with XRE-family HTH domain